MLKNIFLLFLISDYYFVAWLMLAKTPYTIDSLASWSDPYHLSTFVGDVEERVNTKTFKLKMTLPDDKINIYSFELGWSGPSSF